MTLVFAYARRAPITGNLHKMLTAVCDTSCRYHKTLISIEDPVESEVGSLMDTAFQLAGDLALFDETVRMPCRAEQTAARVALAFGDACARARDRQYDRVMVVAVDPFLVEELQTYLHSSQLPTGVCHVVDVRTMLPQEAREGPTRARE